MEASTTGEITQLLVASNNGDRAALAQLTPLVHTELNGIDRRHKDRRASPSYLPDDHEETAEALKVSVGTVKSATAEAWLYSELGNGGSG